MSLTTGEMTPADLAAVTCNNDGFGNGGWWLILLFLLIGWNGNGFGRNNNAGAQDNYVLASDFATLQRQLSDGFGTVEKGTDTIRNGLCDGFYTNAQLINGVNTNIMQNANTIQSQLANCCCENRTAIADLKYTVGATGNDIARQAERGFCDTNYALATNTTAIVQNAHTDADRIIARIDAMENARQAERIAQLQSDNQALRFAASQAEQNQYLIGQLRQPTPIPAYTVANPNCCYSGCGCGA